MYRYLGNKARLTQQILAVARSVAPRAQTVADPMCGTASVAAAFAESGYAVTAADELTFPVLHARARLLHRTPPKFAGGPGASYEGSIAALNSVLPIKGLFFREYSSAGSPHNGCKPRAYFTPENGAKIDAIRLVVKNWRARAVVTDYEADLLLHDLILAVNRVANIAGTYGYYRSTWNPQALRPVELVPSRFMKTRKGHKVLQGPVEALASSITADLCYLDPPYTKRQYAGNYHILETVAAEDEPKPVGEGGLRDWYGQYSSFCSRRTVRDAFRAVLSKLGVRHVLISYSEDGLVPPDEILALLAEFGAVHRFDFVTPRFRSNGGKCAPVIEHLYHLAAA